MPEIHPLDPDFSLTLLSYEEKRRKDSTVKIVLCEGDSWNSLGGVTTSIVQEVVALDTEDKILLVNLSYPGDTLHSMVQVAHEQHSYFRTLMNPQFGTTWDAIFLSAGGNDILDWLDGAFEGIQPVFWTDWYAALIEIVKTAQPYCPIFAHGYTSSFPIQYSKVWWKFWEPGPWLGPRLQKKYPTLSKSEHRAKVTQYLRTFHSALRSLEFFDQDKFTALLPHRDYPALSKFANEIHPAPGVGGYGNIALALYKHLKKL